MFCVQHLIILDMVKEWKKLRDSEWKKNLRLPSLVLKYLNSLRDESDEPNFTHEDKYMRWIERQIIKKGRLTYFNQYYSTKRPDNFPKSISGEVNVKEVICQVIEANVNFVSKEKNSRDDEYDDYGQQILQWCKNKRIYFNRCSILQRVYTFQQCGMKNQHNWKLKRFMLSYLIRMRK